MGYDFLILLLLIIFAFSSRFYSQIVSVIFENIFIRFFRSLTPRYTTSYFKSMFLSMISFRNQGMTYTALSFLNSGIIQSFQAWGLMLGSYLGLVLALFVLNIADPVVLFFILGLTYLLSLLSETSFVFRIAKLFFFFCLILTSYSLLIYILSQSQQSYYVQMLVENLLTHTYLIVPFALCCFLLFKNTFTVLGILYALSLVFNLNPLCVFAAVTSLFTFNAFSFVFNTRKSHRETKLIAFLNLFLTLVLSASLLLYFSSHATSFLNTLLVYSVLLGLLGWSVSPYLNTFSKKLFPKSDHGTTRTIQLYSSVVNYPTTLLIELYYQEYKKLFVHVNATFELMISNLIKQESEISLKLHKYFEISEKVFWELSRLQISLHEMEKTAQQAEFVSICEIRLKALSRFLDSIRFFQDISASQILNESHILFFQKIYDGATFVVTEMIENEIPKSMSISLLLTEWDTFSKILEEQKKKGELEAPLCSEMQIHAMKLIESLKAMT